MIQIHTPKISRLARTVCIASELVSAWTVTFWTDPSAIRIWMLRVVTHGWSRHTSDLWFSCATGLTHPVPSSILHLAYTFYSHVFIHLFILVRHGIKCEKYLVVALRRMPTLDNSDSWEVTVRILEKNKRTESKWYCGHGAHHMTVRCIWSTLKGYYQRRCVGVFLLKLFFAFFAGACSKSKRAKRWKAQQCFG